MMDFNKIEAEERHIFKLWTLCRLCGQAGEKLQYCLDNYGELLEQLYSINLTLDDPAVHPQMVCQKCRLILQHYLKRGHKTKGKGAQGHLPTLPELYTFNKHSKECDVCDRASGLLPKRKRSSDAVEDVTPAKVAREESEQPVTQPEGDTGTEDNTVEERGSIDDLVSPQTSSRANVLLQAIQGTIGDDSMTNQEEELNKPEQEGFTKYVYLNMIRRFKARGIKGDRAMESIDVNRFTQKNFASTFLTCALCKRLPLKPVTTECKHIFCEACISDWLNFGNVCPKCEEVIIELSDATEQLNHLYMLLDASCSYAGFGCEAKLTPFEIHDHEKDCPHNTKADDKEGYDSSDEEEDEPQPEDVPAPPAEVAQKAATRKRKSLRFITQSVGVSRLDDLIRYLDTKCREDREDKIDVLFYLLRGALSAAGDVRHKNIELLWRNKKPALPRQRKRRLPPPPRPKQLPNRRKGTPRKRGRTRKVDVIEQEAIAISDQEEEEEEQDEDLEKDKTWTPSTAAGRRLERQEEKDDEDNEEEEDSQRTSEAAETEIDTAVQEIINSCNVVTHVVIEGSDQSVDGASATAE